MGFDGGSLALASSAIGAASSAAGGVAQYGAYNTQGAIARRLGGVQSTWESLRAQDAERRGQLEAGRAYNAEKQLQGAQRVAAAASNVDVGAGSAGLLESQTHTLGALDRLTIQNNAFLEALGYKNAAQNDLWGGKYAQMNAQAKANSSLLQGVLGGARDLGYGASIYGKFRIPAPTDMRDQTGYDAEYLRENGIY